MAELKLFSSRINQYKSLLLRTYIGFNENIDKVLDLVKNLIFRYNTISSKNPNDLTPLFNSFTYKISHKEISKISEIKTAFQKVYVSDEEFISIFREKEFTYTNPTSRKLIEYILYQIENSVQNKSDFNIKDPIATIEHILPQSQENIKNKELYKYLNNIANFTLLESRLNREVGNLDFKDKIKVYKASSYKITNELQEFPQWDVDQIKHRQHNLAKIAKNIWRIEF